MPRAAGPVPVPRYLEIQNILRERILDGTLCPGQRLAGERLLAREFAVSPVTMSRALEGLVREGLIIRRSGGGTYVLEPEDRKEEKVSLASEHSTLFIDTSPIHDPNANYYMGPILTGIQDVAAERACSLRFVQPSEEDDGIRPVRTPDGLLFIAPTIEREQQLAALARAGLPMVLCGAQWKNVPVPTVDSDNFGGAEQVVDYLARLGHRRIIYISSQLYMSNHMDRLAGFQQSLARYDLPAEEALILHASTPADLGEETERRLDAALLSQNAPTAVFASGYGLALVVLARARALGLHIPNDLSLVGFDDPLSAAHLSPPLTTVRQPLREMGRRAAEMLLDLAGRDSRACPVEVLPCELIIRGSCLSTRHA